MEIEPASAARKSDTLKSPGNVMKYTLSSGEFYSQNINGSLFAAIGLYDNYGLGIDYGNWSGVSPALLA